MRERSREDVPAVVVGLNAVIIAVTDEHPRVLTVSLPADARIEGGSQSKPGPGAVEALPTGPLDPAGDRTLDRALRRWVKASTGMDLGYVEQLYTFGDRFRDPRESAGGPRVVSVAYLALVREGKLTPALAARWREVYEFLPWEDRRGGRPRALSDGIDGVLRGWTEAGHGPAETESRRERASIVFGLGGAPWDGDRVLERYELLYETEMVAEARRDLGPEKDAETVITAGREMAFDHRRILATALGRIRGKIKYRPVIFELVPETFTLLQLQRTVEALAGVVLHKQNFRRLVEKGGLVEGTGVLEHLTGGRPAELFRFRRGVLRERPAPGVGLPGRSR